MEEPRFIELAIGGTSRRGTPAHIETLPLVISRCQTNLKGTAPAPLELYRSYFLYDESIVEHLNKTRTVRGYKGVYALDRLLFDIDRGELTFQQCQDKMKMFCENLASEWVGEDEVQVYFSGRGFHIVTPDFFNFPVGTGTPEIVKMTLMKYFAAADDIWYGPSLIRVENTINDKSQLYKIPLTLAEAYSLTPDAIEALAKTPRQVETLDYGVTFGEPKHHDKIVVPELRPVATPRPDNGPEPTGMVTCMQKLFNRGGVEGKRHKEGIMLAALLRRQGVPKTGVWALVKQWAPTLGDAEVDKIVNDVWTKGYSYSCNHPSMMELCDTGCVFYKRKNFSLDVFSSADLEADFVRFVRSDFGDKSFDLADIYRLPVSYKFLPGELITLTGNTKLGKTAFMQNIVVSVDRMKTLYINTEIAQWLLYRRFVQIRHHMTKEQVMAHYRQNSNTLSQALSHIQCLSVTPSLTAIRRMIGEHTPQIVVIDTSEGIHVDNAKESFQQQRGLFLGLRDLARDLNVIIFVIHHVHKGAAVDDRGRLKDLTLDSPKGASAVVQQSDKVIAFEGEQHAPLRRLKSLGARDESEMQLVMNFDWRTMTFHQL